MKTRLTELESLGWDQWFETRNICSQTETVARVAAVDRDQFLLMGQTGTFRGKLAGSYRYQRRLSEERPCVGDWICVEQHPGDDFALIYSVLERKTSLRRKSAGDSVDYQMIAANIDTVIVVQSCHFDFNLKRLERYLVMIKEGGAEPFILLSKTDLVGQDVLDAQLSAIRSADIQCPVLLLSNVTRQGVHEIREFLQPSRTYCFVGSSGVGKSTLINRLVGREIQQTKDVSGTGEGRHTTVRRELLMLEGGALVIDNPGMREFGVLGAEQSIDAGFIDIAQLAENCRFRNCTHTNEPHCAVIKALQAGEISEEHYENFTKLKKESEYNDMTYQEKRKKDRAFGKMVKSVKKNMTGS